MKIDVRLDTSLDTVPNMCRESLVNLLNLPIFTKFGYLKILESLTNIGKIFVQIYEGLKSLISTFLILDLFHLFFFFAFSEPCTATVLNFLQSNFDDFLGSKLGISNQKYLNN